jgi:hypothetical protein
MRRVRCEKGEGWMKGGRIEGRGGVVMRKRTLFPSLRGLYNYYTGITLNFLFLTITYCSYDMYEITYQKGL